MPTPVLICDDSALARKQVRKSLPENWEIDVQFATNGREALDVLASQDIKVLFLDLTMPEIDGIGVLEQIKERQYDHVKVIVISADIQPAMQQKVDELGALAFIRKPVNSPALQDILGQYGLA